MRPTRRNPILPLAAAVLTLAAGAAAQNAPAVRIESQIIAQAYTWTVTNAGPSPMTRFEIPQHNVYYGEVPPGWTLEITEERFAVEAQTTAAAIVPGGSAKFTATVASSGAVPGHATAIIGLADGATVEVPVDLAPRRNPVSAVIVIATLLVVIATIQVVLVERGRR